MMLLLGEHALAERATVARGELGALARGLAAELEAVETRELYVPKEKALLSRAGGRCERDGSILEFDPFAPHRHRCPVCGTMHVGEFHDRYWVFWYQLWLAERAVHGALLGRLLEDERALTLSSVILDRYADQYLLYPNRDNVLGPTRVFFSTYLESIWLLNLCIAVDLLEDGGRARSLGARVRERIVEPGAALIASYDEGGSNRQVWNDAALLAASRLLGRDRLLEDAVIGPTGLLFHLEHGLLADGTWYEGENYHLFAHRGLWYGVMMAEHAGLSLSAEAGRRFAKGFAAPFLTALPDLTLPSRRDSQYAISLRQPRFAELCELGLGREDGDGDPRLRAMLGHLYDDAYPRREIGRWNSTADVERNLAGTQLSRADLGWRSLLFARPALPPLGGAPLGTVLLEAQGIGVFRREQERVYVALDYGTSGGGHGHPDRLNVLLSDDDMRWLDDMGTGSYVDPSLHWYRSTLAHSAPLFNGYEQQRVDGELLAFEEREDVGWICARARELFPGVMAMRTLVAMPDYVLDELAWEANDHTELVMDLPIHVVPAAISFGRFAPGRRAGLTVGAPLEDTLGVLDSSIGRWMDPHTAARITARDGERVLNGFLISSLSGLLYRVTGPGAPGRGRLPFLIFRVPSRGETAWVRVVWDWRGDVDSVSLDARRSETTVGRRDGSRDRLRQTVTGFRVVREMPEETRRIDLAGLVPLRPPSAPDSHRDDAELRRLSVGETVEFELGKEQYRRSEEQWEDAGRPNATIRVFLHLENQLQLQIIVRKPAPFTFAPPSAVNVYDNESADVNGDGVQLYFVSGNGPSAWLLVPQPNDEEPSLVRIRPIQGWGGGQHVEARWRRVAGGYELDARIRFAPGQRELALGVVINEKHPDRERRRGQLVLGRRAGEFVYLRGDREELGHLLRFEIST